MPLYPQTPQPTPWYLAHEGLLAVIASSSGVLTANTTYLTGVYLPVPAVAVNMRLRHGATSAGNLDMGIYDASGNRLDHTGVTACTAANGVQTIALSSGGLSLAAGRYYLALWVDNATDTYYRISMGSASTGWANILNGTNPNGTGSANTTTGLLSTFTAMGGTTVASVYVAAMATLNGTGF